MDMSVAAALADWHAPIRPVLHAAPVPDDHPPRIARHAGRRSRRTSDHPVVAGTTLLAARLFAAAFDKLNRGVLLLDTQGRVHFANRSARRILHRREGLSLRQHQLAFADAEADAAFDELLERGEGSLLLRINGQGPERGVYRVLVSPLDSAAAGEGYCVFIYEPVGGRRPLPELVLKNLYGLTAAEARLTNALFVGHSLQAAATALGVSVNTAKTTLKRVFGKCDVGTQAELLQLLSLGPRTL